MSAVAIDRGTEELRSYRREAAGNSDDQRASTVLGCMMARGDLLDRHDTTDEKAIKTAHDMARSRYEAGLRYERLYRRVRGQWSPKSVFGNFIAGDRASSPSVEGAGDPELELKLTRAVEALADCGVETMLATERVVLFGEPVEAVLLVRFGLDALAEHFERGSRKPAR